MATDLPLRSKGRVPLLFTKEEKLPEGIPKADLYTQELRAQERKEKLLFKQEKAKAKLAMADAKLAKAAVANLKKQIVLQRTNRAIELDQAGKRRAWFGRVVPVRGHTRSG